MLFNSFTFLALLLPLFVAYWLAPNQTARLSLLLAASLVFYSWYHWPSVFLLLGTITGNYYIGLRQERRRSKGLLAAVVIANLSILLWFKYVPFLLGELKRGLDLVHIALPIPALPQWLPLGISFFTFQVVAYQVDVYRGEIPAERSFLVFGVFKSFFGQLIAGPIVRAREFLPQLHQRALFDPEICLRGALLFIVGGCLKIGAADVLAQFVHEAFAHAADQTTSEAWLGLYAFAFQLFADFWGYSTMAVGLGLLFGLQLPTNFQTPYLATSLQEFWRRWHITLSSWFRDYVYIPLGGNRRRPLVNLIITMTVAGVWHGAGWNFVLWGALHGTWLALERKLGGARGGQAASPRRRILVRVLRTFLVFHGVCLLWVLFRAPTLGVALAYYARLLLPPYTANPIVPEVLATWLIGFAALHPFVSESLRGERVRAASVRRLVALSVCMLLLALSYGGQAYDFIYFAF